MSYQSAITVPTKSVPFMRSLFPGYRRRDVRIQAAEKVSFHDLNWSGGSKTEYSLISLADGRTKSLAAWGQIAPWANPYEGASTVIPAGFAIVSTGYFCGKASLATIYVHPSNLTPLLPAA